MVAAPLRADRGEFFFELRFALVQCAQPQLPAVQLDRQLIDVTGDFRPLRFVLGQATANVLQSNLRTRGRGRAAGVLHKL